MPKGERSIEYTLTFVDNVTPTTERAAQSQEKLGDRVNATTTAVANQDVAFLKTVTSLAALRMGVMGLTHSVIMLGLVNDEGAQKLLKMTAGMTLFVSAAQAMKGVIGLSKQLRNAEIALASVETYRAVLKNPAMLGLVATAVGASAGLAGYYVGRSKAEGNQTTVQQNITFNGQMPSASARGVARDTLEVMGG